MLSPGQLVNGSHRQEESHVLDNAQPSHLRGKQVKSSGGIAVAQEEQWDSDCGKATYGRFSSPPSSAPGFSLLPQEAEKSR